MLRILANNDLISRDLTTPIVLLKKKSVSGAKTL